MRSTEFGTNCGLLHYSFLSALQYKYNLIESINFLSQTEIQVKVEASTLIKIAFDL